MAVRAARPYDRGDVFGERGRLRRGRRGDGEHRENGEHREDREHRDAAGRTQEVRRGWLLHSVISACSESSPGWFSIPLLPRKKAAAAPVATAPTGALSMVRPALVIFAIAFAIRLVHVVQIRSTPFFSLLMGDSRGYDEWAQRIAGGDWWGTEVFYQAPLYPYFLGVIYAVAGRDLLIVRLIQAAIGAASCVLIALAAGRLISRRAGIAAGVMLALYAPAIFFDGLLQKSVLDVFFVSVALWLIARLTTHHAEPAEAAEKSRNALRVQRAPRDIRSLWKAWLSLGLAIGGLSLTRENALVFTIVIVGWALTRSWRAAATFVLGLALVIVPVAA